MQETRNNRFGSKKRSTTLIQAKTGKDECQNGRATYVGTLLLHFGTHAYLFLPEEGSCYVFSTRNNYSEFLASDGVIFKSVIKPFFKTPVFDAPLTSI